MLKTKTIAMEAPAGNPCARSNHPAPLSDFADFGEFEAELVSLIAADDSAARDDDAEPSE